MTRSRRAPTRRAAVVLAVLAAACGPVAGDPPLDIAVNDCPSNPCDAYKPFASGMSSAQCRAGYCQVTAKLDFTLVVTPADTSYYASGSAFVLPAAHLFDNPSSKCPSGVCTTLPGLGVVSGYYLIDPTVWDIDPARNLHPIRYYLGANGVVMPAHVTYRPLLGALDAAALGLPLSTLRAQSIEISGTSPGPGGGPIISFRQTLPPGTYERVVVPEPPFDAFFPPEVSVVDVSTGAAALENDELKALDAPVETVTLQRDDNAHLDGWIVRAIDPTTGTTVSNEEILGDAWRTTSSTPIYSFQINMNRHADTQTNVSVILEPPAGSVATPSFRYDALGGVLDKLPLSYPTLPPPATVRGFVAATVSSDPVAADVLFTSTKIYVVAGSNPNRQLTYSASTAALPATDGAPARYSIVLPRGEYQVTVTPRDPRYARVVLPQTFTVDALNDPQDGKNLAVSAKRVVRGSAFVSDGRPLAHADVVALPAAASFVPPSSPAAPPALTRSNAPRGALARTDSQGTFTLDLDPGSYDIAVKPAQGSRLPWVVLPSRVVGDADLALDAVLVPAPVPAGLTVLDPSGNAVAGAMVRAYAIPTGGGAYVEIGRALTDAKGHYDMFLAGAPH